MAVGVNGRGQCRRRCIRRAVACNGPTCGRKIVDYATLALLNQKLFLQIVLNHLPRKTVENLFRSKQMMFIDHSIDVLLWIWLFSKLL